MIDLVKAGDEATLNGEIKGIEIRKDGNNIIKFAYTGIEHMFLQNETRFLRKLSNTGFAPKFDKFDYSDASSSISHLIVENLGKSEPVTDEVVFRRNCALLLWTLKKHGIRHGDITPKNIIVKNNKPMLVDFHQSKFDHESGEDKRPEGDAYWMWESALELSPDTSRHIRKWRVIRPFITKGGSILDFGCAEGDYCLFARSENGASFILGSDIDLKAVQFANNNWQKYGCNFTTEWQPDKYFITTFFMSVFAHIVHTLDYYSATFIIEKLITQRGQLFFETQLYGDGPGLPEHKTDDDVYKFLKQFGKVEKLVTIPVFGREPLARSVWRIT